MDDTQRLFVDRLKAIGVTLDRPDVQLRQFDTYYRGLVEWNTKMNLTGITEREAVYEKHFYDSLTLSLATDLRQVASLADIGSGAGFPSLPVKIAFPHLKVAIVDSLAKRIRFLQQLTEELGLEDVLCVHGRAEDLGRAPEHRDRYDVVTARAVARLAALNELCLPFSASGGLFIAMKGADVEEEREESRYSARKLNAEIRETISLTLPGEGSARNLIIFAKKGSTPQTYPRKAGIPLKQPLISGNIRI